MNTLERTPEGWMFSTLIEGTHWDRFAFQHDYELADHILKSGLLNRGYVNINQDNHDKSKKVG